METDFDRELQQLVAEAKDACLFGSWALSFGLAPGARPIGPDVDLLIKPPAAMSLLQAATRAGLQTKWLEKGAAVFGSKIAIVELKFAYSGTTDEELVDIASRNGGVLNLDHLYTIKMSHRYLKDSPHFKKTRDDILFMRTLGAKIFDEAFLRRREAETYTYGHPSLEREKAEFFSGDGVSYVYDHDSIHEAVALGDRPAYQEYAEPGREVKSSKARFLQVPEYVRLNGVIEEAMVLAIERSLVPHPPAKMSYTHVAKVFEFALQKVCTSITSGWFREYAWENYDQALAQADPVAMWHRFEDRLNRGQVRPYS